jgi:hypothetical protein
MLSNFVLVLVLDIVSKTEYEDEDDEYDTE